MADQRTPEQIEAEIAAQREKLAATVDQLTAKLDVKSRARGKLASLKQSATTGSGSLRPDVVAAVGSLTAMAVVLLLWRHRHTH